MTTDIKALDQQNLSFLDKEEVDIDNLPSQILDLTLDLELRIYALELYYDEFKDNTIEYISKLSGMYQFSGSKILEQYLFEIVTQSKISSFLKFEACKSLFMFSEIEEDTDSEYEDFSREYNSIIIKRNQERKNKAYKALDFLCNTFEDIPTLIKIEAIIMLMQNESYFNSCNTYFKSIINDINIECDFRYKTILSLENKNIPKLNDYLINFCYTFLLNKNNMTMYRILSAQYLLQKCEIDDFTRIDTEKILLSFAQDNELDQDIRADAADTLLGLGSDNIKPLAREIILLLGRINGHVKTLFDNAQNVHTNAVEESVKQIIEFLASFPVMKIKKNPITFEYVKRQIEKIFEDNKKQFKSPCKNKHCIHFSCIFCNGCTDIKSTKNITSIYFCTEQCETEYESEQKIYISLNRIEMDRALHSKFNITLKNLLVKVWSYIYNHKHDFEMKERLLQELQDMSGTCSTGFASRLANVLSGYSDFHIKISWEDQIIANLSGRLNAFARKITSDSPFLKEKLHDIIELWLNNNTVIKHDVIRSITSSTKITDVPPMKQIINKFLETDKEKKIEECLQDFSASVINEMMLDPILFNQRQNFLLFFRTHMLPIREEMYQEFKDHIEDVDFDLYFRKAISKYEGF